MSGRRVGGAGRRDTTQRERDLLGDWRGGSGAAVSVRLCHVTRRPRRLWRRPARSNADRIASPPPHPSPAWQTPPAPPRLRLRLRLRAQGRRRRRTTRRGRSQPREDGWHLRTGGAAGSRRSPGRRCQWGSRRTPSPRGSQRAIARRSGRALCAKR